MKWLTVVKTCVPCVALLLAALGLAACALDPAVIEVLHDALDLVVDPLDAAPKP